MMRTILVFCAFLALPVVTSAQTVIGATKVQVTASPDHNVTALGSAVVTSYRLTYKDGAITIGTPQDAGKPTPNAQNTFDVDIPAGVLAVKNKALTVLVEIVGPGGVDAEPVSGPFGYLGAPRPSGTAPLPKR
jgi:hypothetical protein